MTTASELSVGGRLPEAHAIQLLTRACYRSERAGFRELTADATTQTVELLLGLAERWPERIDDLVVTIGPDGSANIVISFDEKEADITVVPDGREFHVSVYEPGTGDVSESVIDSPGAARDFVVRSL